MRRPVGTLLTLLATGCGAADAPDRPPPRPAAPLSLPKVLCGPVADGAPPRPCRTVDEVERWLSSPDLEIVGADSPPSGIQGARVLTLRLPGPPEVVFRAKWRAQATLTSKNDPRRELVAYAIQKLFALPDRVVVPPTAAHCFPVDMYRAQVLPGARASFADVPCVLGTLTYWLEDVTTIVDAEREGWFGSRDDALDEELFAENRIYRESVADVNLLTYLIDHADTHRAQFVIRRDPQAPLVYSVDNSMSFGVKRNTRVKVDWARIQVPALSRRAVDKLRAADLDALSSIAELEVRAGGRLAPVAPRRRAAEPAGIRWIEGRLVIGMTVDELDMLRDRVSHLFLAIDGGEVKLF
ncbi:MAG TPA: hypothetical protein VFU21_26870 [Kofleriaceae bacterium]|nr:hypothetical protein [Kofleriaceae bacterium]